MADCLFLSHRIPYPPDKGDKIRSYRLFRHVAQRFRVHLGTFIDDPADQVHGETVRAMAGGDCRILELDPRLARWRGLTGLLTGQPLTLPYLYRTELARWVRGILAREEVQLVVVYSSGMAPYVLGPIRQRRVMDFVDADSQKWAQYARRQRGPLAWIYRREATRLLAFEQEVVRQFDAALFVSRAEADLFCSLAPELAGRVDHYDNGVDAAYFSPLLDYPDPYPPGGPVVVFTGAMDYWPNVEAVTWFAAAVLPRIRAVRPGVRLAVVGSRPAPAVTALVRDPGILVTGRVPDVRPYLAHAALAVAPMRLGQGIQNKVLEAMAMAKPVLATGKAMEGVRLCPGLERWVADDPVALAKRGLALLDDPGDAGTLGRRCVIDRYDWATNLARVDRHLAGALA
ncbi:MAG: TIGR03087 family PEP-CTERM/XrtA system glycosyltransferase [Magnetococcales bacterium]|nr:TIGR03087 family PEP-CTERM/XrtA system glycosyltransferase [Magnetococcales bacterium]